MTIIEAIFTGVASAVQNFTTVLGNTLTGITSMFYDSTDGLTFLGVLLTIAMGVGLVYWGFRLIKSLIKHRG